MRVYVSIMMKLVKAGIILVLIDLAFGELAACNSHFEPLVFVAGCPRLEDQLITALDAIVLRELS